MECQIPINPGLIEMPEDKNDYKYGVIFGVEKTVPRKFKRNLPYGLNVPRQGQVPCCVSSCFTFINQYKSYVNDNNNLDLSFRKIHSATGPYERGRYLREVAKYLQSNGQPQDKYCPDDITLSPTDFMNTILSPEGIEDSSKRKIGPYSFVNDGDINELCSAIIKEPIAGSLGGINEDWRKPFNEIVKQTATPNWYHSVCCVPETQVMTISGYKKIKDIKKGNLVLTHRNRFKKVLGISKRKVNEEIYEIYNSSMVQPLKCTKEHPIFVKQFKGKRNGLKSYVKRKSLFNSAEFIKAEDVNEGSIVFSPIRKDKKNILNKNKAKLLGYYIADGNITGQRKNGNYRSLRFSFNRTEIDYINDVINLMYKEFKLLPHLEKFKASNGINLCFYSVEACKWFKEFGGSPNNKNIKFEVLLSNQEILGEIEKGWLNGDGHIEKNRKVKKIFTSEKNLALQLSYIYQRLNVSYSIQERKKNITKICGRSCDCKGGFSISVFLEKGKRKRHFENNYLVGKIEQINKIEYNGFVHNLQVEDDESYTANQIAVHNCLWDYDLDERWIGIYNWWKDGYRRISIDYKLTGSISFKDLPDGDNKTMLKAVKVIGEIDVYIIIGNNKHLIPDSDTQHYYLGTLGILNPVVEITKEELNNYTEGEKIPSIKLMRAIEPIAKDIFLKNEDSLT